MQSFFNNKPFKPEKGLIKIVNWSESSVIYMYEYFNILFYISLFSLGLFVDENIILKNLKENSFTSLLPSTVLLSPPPEQCKNYRAHDWTLLKPLTYALEIFL